MTPEQFAALAGQNYNRIPVSREVLADMDTPLSTYRKLADQPYSYLLESVQGGEKWGRYSIIGLPCRTLLRVFGQRIDISRDNEIIESLESADPLAFVEEFQARYRSPDLDSLPVFFGGLVGYFAYDAVRYVEPRLAESTPEDELGTPDVMFMLSEEVVVFDNLAGTLHIVVHVDPGENSSLEAAERRLDELESILEGEIPSLGGVDLAAADGGQLHEEKFQSNFTRQEYEAAVERIKEYTLAGDVMQVVPSQRMSIDFTAKPINLYRALRNLNPSPYMYMLHMGDFHIVGSSPEILARLQDGAVTVRPLAGTRHRGDSEAEDKALEAELLADPKEIAEHLMLIDLGRNDMGRICDIGSVELTEKMVVERYSHVMHITSNVTGTLEAGRGAVDVVRATLPAGTLSGAPKIRAMEIIDEVETVKRGIYGGAVGYISWAGDMDMAIAIRTAVIKDGKLYIQAGGGVVADSVPALEWEETMNKARAMFRAAGMVTAE
ncbi:MAG: anthranilate synthase component 1 [Halieaceae bacterium]|jgi:anthranilate synthase component 1